MDLTRNEREIMDTLWKAAKPLTRTEIITMSVDKSWKESSIHILLNSLLKKEAIAESGYVRTGKCFGRTFEPTITLEEYYADFFVNVAKYTNATQFFSALFKNEHMTLETVLALETMLEEKKKDIEDGN